MSCPKVSVIIPVYNTEKYLCECPDSVVKQRLNITRAQPAHPFWLFYKCCPTGENICTGITNIT